MRKDLRNESNCLEGNSNWEFYEEFKYWCNGDLGSDGTENYEPNTETEPNFDFQNNLEGKEAKEAEEGKTDLNPQNLDPKTDSTKEKTKIIPNPNQKNLQIIPKEKKDPLPKKFKVLSHKRGRKRNSEENTEYRKHDSKDADNEKKMIKTSCSRSIFDFLTRKIEQWREQKGIRDLEKLYRVNLDKLKMVKSYKDEDSLLWLNSTVEDLFKNATLWEKGTPESIYNTVNYYGKIFEKIKEYQNDDNEETEKLINFLNTKVYVLYEMYCGKIAHYKEFKILEEVLREGGYKKKKKKEQNFEENCWKNSNRIFNLAKELKCYLYNYPNMKIEEIIEEIEKMKKKVNKMKK